MSEENVETMRRALNAFAAGDVDRLLSAFDPDVDFEPYLAMVEGSYTGHDGIRRFMADNSADMSVLGAEIEDIRDLGERVLALGSFRFQGRGSGVEGDTPFAVLASFRDGRMVHVKDYGDHSAGLKAAGLSA